VRINWRLVGGWVLMAWGSAGIMALSIYGADTFMRYVVAGLAILAGLGMVAVDPPGRTLRAKVAGLKPLRGKSRGAVRRVLGQPDATEDTQSGEVCEWDDGAYRVEVTFRDGRCVRVAEHESED